MNSPSNRRFSGTHRGVRCAAAGTGLALAVVTGQAQAAAVDLAVDDVLHCGSVVTHDVTLTQDLVGCTGNGLVIGADGVDVDLDGHLIQGAGVFASLSGVDVDGFDRVTVRDGRIAGFSRGVVAYAADDLTVQRLTVADTLEAINVEESSAATLRDNRLTDNREGLSLRHTVDAVISGNRISGSHTTGVRDVGSQANRYSENSVIGSEFDGIALESAVGTVLAGNEVLGNGLGGIRSIAGSGLRFVGNNAVANGDHGIHDDGESSSWQANSARGNGRVGLLADGPDVVDEGGNRAGGNREADCVGVICR